MMWLPEDRKSFEISLAVLIHNRSVTATQPASQPPTIVAKLRSKIAERLDFAGKLDYVTSELALGWGYD